MSLAVTSVARIHILSTRDRAAASLWIEKSRHLPAKFPIIHHFSIPALTAFLRMWSGDVDDAERLARQALETFDEMHVPLGLPALEAFLVLADILVESARIAEAEAVLEEADELAVQLGAPGYRLQVELRKIELAAADSGPCRGVDAATQAMTLFKDKRLGAALRDRLRAQQAYWLLAEGRTIEASTLTASVRASPARSILSAKFGGWRSPWSGVCEASPRQARVDCIRAP